MALHFLLLASMLVVFSQCTSPPDCTESEYRCDNQRCIDKRFICDIDNDCGDNSDERYCDMNERIFLFQQESSANYVTLTPNLTAPITSFTVCVRILTELDREFSLFSASNPPNKDNDLLLFRSSTDGSQYSIHVGNTEVEFKTSVNNTERNHICATWESTTGVMRVWVNGKPSLRKITKVGYIIEKDLKIILGQEQDSYGGAFDPKQSFVGEMGHVNMWNYVMSSTDIENAAWVYNRDYSGNVINWKALNYDITGDVSVTYMSGMSK